VAWQGLPRKLAFFISFVVIMLVPGCPLPSGTITPSITLTPTTPPATPPMLPPVKVLASFPNGAPALNKTKEFVVIVQTPGQQVTDLSVTIDLPVGLERVGGELSWFGAIPRGSEVTIISASVKAIKTGNHSVIVNRNQDPAKNLGMFWASTGFPIYVLVGENSAQWGTDPPRIPPIPTQSPKPTESPPPIWTP